MFAVSTFSTEPRYGKVPANEVSTETQQGANIPAVGLFNLRLRDTLDFGIDLTEWLGANHSPDITAAVWAVATDSPKTPILTGSAFDKDGICSVTVSCAVGAAPGDTYYLECAIALGAVVATAGVPPIPARSIVRRLHIIAAKG